MNRQLLFCVIYSWSVTCGHLVDPGVADDPIVVAISNYFYFKGENGSNDTANYAGSLVILESERSFFETIVRRLETSYKSILPTN